MSESKPKHYLAQAAWRLVKEYAGIYSFKHFGTISTISYELLLEVMTKELISNSKDRARFKKKYLCVEEYKFPQYRWHKVNSSLTDDYINAVSTLVVGPRVPRAYPTDRFVATARHITNELSVAYYNKYHYAACKVMAAAAESIADDKMLDASVFRTTPGAMPITWLPAVKLELLQPSVLDDLAHDVLKSAIKSSNEASIAHKTHIHKFILEALPTHPNRKKLYERLLYVTKAGMIKCACGKSITSASYHKHLRSHNHTFSIMREYNMHTLEYWYQETGKTPYGFFRKEDGTWRHIIPEDPTRPLLHLIRHPGGINLCEYISTTADGRGRVINIV